MDANLTGKYQMKELHALVDFENVQPTMDELSKLAPGFTDVWLFHGPHQAKQAQQLAATHDRVTLVPRSGNGPNALDFHLSFYLGYVAAKHPDAHMVVVANDKGYDPMIAHARMLEFTVKRVGHKAKPAAVSKVVKPAVKKSTVAAKAAPVKQKAPAKVAAPAKKPVSKPPVAKSVTAKKAAVQQPAAKKSAAKKTPVKKAAVKKAPIAKTQSSKVVVPAKAAVPPEVKEFTRIKKGLAKMGDKAPHKLKSFLRHVGALIGKNPNAEQIDAVVEKLEQEKVVRVAGDLVLYG